MPAVTVEAVIATALALSHEERSELIDRLIASVESELDLHPAWDEELARRVAAMEAGGDAELIPGDQVMAQMRERIASHRRRA